jgi:hypothetical protein
MSGHLCPSMECAMNGHRMPYYGGPSGPGQTTLPEVTEIHRWRIQPGDRIVAYVDATDVTSAQAQIVAQRIRGYLKLAPDFPILVAGHNLELMVADTGPGRKDAARGES